MRWPWVSRALYDLAIEQVGDLRLRESEARNQLFSEIRRYETEIATLYATMIPRPVQPSSGAAPTASVAPKREPSMVSQVIREQSGGDPRLAGYLRSYATRLERDGESPEDIALHLSEWESTEGYTLPAEVSI